MNVLVDDGFHVQLTDFGLSEFQDFDTSKSTTAGGNLAYNAPELLDPPHFQLASFKRTKATDVYSFACLCYEVGHLFLRIQVCSCI
jgi:serine/threonine protein kinase